MFILPRIVAHVLLNQEVGEYLGEGPDAEHCVGGDGFP